MMRRSARGPLFAVVLLLVSGCQTAASDGMTGSRSSLRYPDAVLAHRAALPLGNPDITLLLNREGSPRVENPELYRVYRQAYESDLVRWSAEPGIAINPNYAIALFAKESGFDPVATSHVPANGVAQMTPIADADLLRIARDDTRWQWVLQEARAWPRHPLVHDLRATKPRTDSLVRAGAIHAGNEYFFNPGTETRAALIWLRMLADLWRGDGMDSEIARIARERLANGRPLHDSHVLDLVTVSYNQGYPYVMDLLKKHGTKWTEHLNEEAGDYLERIRIYTVIFQNAI